MVWDASLSSTSKYRAAYKERMQNGEVVLCGICKEPIPAKVQKRDRIKHGGKGGLSVDHIVPKSKGGTNDPENLQPTHTKCNHIKADK